MKGKKNRWVILYHERCKWKQRGVCHVGKSSDVEDGDGRGGARENRKQDSSIPLPLSIVFLILCSVNEDL